MLTVVCLQNLHERFVLIVENLVLILTKLQRPSVAEDFLVRSRLTERLEQSRSRRLTLTSAPAGYGKSSLVSAWLKSTADASVWLSIDKTDTDLTLFLSYLGHRYPSLLPRGLSIFIRDFAGSGITAF